MDIKIKNTPEPDSVKLPGSVLYKEDMKKIFEVLEAHDEAVVEVEARIPGREVEILKASGFDAVGIEGEKFSYVKYRAFYGDSHIIVDIQPNSGRITNWIVESDTLLEVISDRVIKIAKEREDKLKEIGMYGFICTIWIPLLWLAGRIVNASWLDGASVAGLELQSEASVQFVMLVMYLPVVIFGARNIIYKGNILVNSPKGKSQIFRDKLSDNWQVSAVWATVSAVLGFLLGLIF